MKKTYIAPNSLVLEMESDELCLTMSNTNAQFNALSNDRYDIDDEDEEDIW